MLEDFFLNISVQHCIQLSHESIYSVCPEIWLTQIIIIQTQLNPELNWRGMNISFEDISHVSHAHQTYGTHFHTPIPGSH